MRSNNSTVGKYTGTPIEALLQACHCQEISEIDHEALARWAEGEGATTLQRSRLFALWTGAEQVTAELKSLLEEISYPRERERLLSYLRDPITPTPAVEDLLKTLAWR